MGLILLALAVPLAGWTAWMLADNYQNQMAEIRRWEANSAWNAAWHERLMDEENQDG